MSMLVMGTVVAKGKKDQVLEMFENLEYYYDKWIKKESGTDEEYTIEFGFSSSMRTFFEYEYFQDPSKEYECEIKATMECEEALEGEKPIELHYKNGEIIVGLIDNGIEYITNEW